MATAHLSARPKPISRSAGESAVAAASYRHRCEMFNERTGEVHDYSNKSSDLLFAGMYAPKNAPGWAHDAMQFWNEVEKRENRKDAQLSREFVIGLPHELSIEQNRWLLQDWVKENFVRRGYVADVVMHAPHAWSDERNVHAHVMVPLRKMIDGEWSKDKDRFIDGKPDVAELHRMRDSWERLANRHLERHGFEERISMKSFAEQGIERIPEIHLGKAAHAQERRGVETERGDILREIQVKNLERDLAAKFEHKVTAAELHKAPAAAVAAEPTAARSAIDRQRAEEREEERRGSFQRNEGTRGVLAAIWSLARTSGASLLHALGIDRTDLMLGRYRIKPTPSFSAEREKERPAERPAVQKPAPEPETPLQRPGERLAEIGKKQMLENNAQEYREARAQSIFEKYNRPQQPPAEPDHSHAWEPAKHDLTRVGRLIDALGVTPAPKREPSFIEKLEAEQKAKGQTLADLVPKRERERDRELDEDFEL